MQITEILDFTHWGHVSRRDFDVKFTVRSWGGYEVWNRANGRHLGWVVQGSDKDWYAYASAAAFRTDPDDVLEHVDPWLVKGIDGSTLRCRPVGIDSTRRFAVRDLLHHLVNERALAVRAAEEASR